MNLGNWSTYFNLLIFMLFWIIPAGYISWKYDSTPQIIIKAVWLYLTGNTAEAISLLREKEDRTKPIRWFYWIPFVGRILIHNRDMKMHPDIRRALMISLFENTVVYFIVGVIVGRMENILLVTCFNVILVIFIILIPGEYLLTIWKPKLFMSDGDIEYVEYICVFYHAFLFVTAGTLIGYLLRPECLACP